MSAERCGFGLAEHIDGCPAPVAHRIVLTSRDIEAFACDEHVVGAELTLDERGDTFATFPTEQDDSTTTREQRDVIAAVGT